MRLILTGLAVLLASVAVAYWPADAQCQSDCSAFNCGPELRCIDPCECGEDGRCYDAGD